MKKINIEDLKVVSETAKDDYRLYVAEQLVKQLQERSLGIDFSEKRNSANQGQGQIQAKGLDSSSTELRQQSVGINAHTQVWQTFFDQKWQAFMEELPRISNAEAYSRAFSESLAAIDLVYADDKVFGLAVQINLANSCLQQVQLNKTQSLGPEVNAEKKTAELKTLLMPLHTELSAKITQIQSDFFAVDKKCIANADHYFLRHQDLFSAVNQFHLLKDHLQLKEPPAAYLIDNYKVLLATENYFQTKEHADLSAQSRSAAGLSLENIDLRIKLTYACLQKGLGSDALAVAGQLKNDVHDFLKKLPDHLVNHRIIHGYLDKMAVVADGCYQDAVNMGYAKLIMGIEYKNQLVQNQENQLTEGAFTATIRNLGENTAGPGTYADIFFNKGIGKDILNILGGFSDIKNTADQLQYENSELVRGTYAIQSLQHLGLTSQEIVDWLQDKPGYPNHTHHILQRVMDLSGRHIFGDKINANNLEMMKAENKNRYLENLDVYCKAEGFLREVLPDAQKAFAGEKTIANLLNIDPVGYNQTDYSAQNVMDIERKDYFSDYIKTINASMQYGTIGNILNNLDNAVLNPWNLVTSAVCSGGNLIKMGNSLLIDAFSQTAADSICSSLPEEMKKDAAVILNTVINIAVNAKLNQLEANDLPKDYPKMVKDELQKQLPTQMLNETARIIIQQAANHPQAQFNANGMAKPNPVLESVFPPQQRSYLNQLLKLPAGIPENSLDHFYKKMVLAEHGITSEEKFIREISNPITRQQWEAALRQQVNLYRQELSKAVSNSLKSDSIHLENGRFPSQQHAKFQLSDLPDRIRVVEKALDLITEHKFRPLNVNLEQTPVFEKTPEINYQNDFSVQ